MILVQQQQLCTTPHNNNPSLGIARASDMRALFCNMQEGLHLYAFAGQAKYCEACKSPGASAVPVL